MKKAFLSCVGSFLLTSSAYAVLPGHLVDAIYNWPQQLWQTDVNMNVIADPGPASNYYWSHFFVFANSTSANFRYGYIGLQTVGNGKKAIFSIWNALEAQGNNCKTFGGEGTGYQCFLNYNFQQGHTYRLRVWQLGSDSTGDWWGGWISDVATGVETTIGAIKSPPNSGLITTSYLFDEYFTNVSSCASLAYGKVGFGNLVGNLTLTPKLNYWVPEGPCSKNIFVQFTGNDFTAASPTP